MNKLIKNKLTGSRKEFTKQLKTYTEELDLDNLFIEHLEYDLHHPAIK